MSSYSLALLGIQNFRKLVLTRICGTMALQAQAIIVGWQIYSLTKDPLMLGLVGLVEAIPAILSALYAGHVVDNNNPRRIFKIAFIALFFNILGLFIVGGGVVPMDTNSLITFLFVGVFFSGLARSYIMPSAFSLLPLVVTRKDIPSASAWLSMGFQIAAVTGPAVAGLIYGGYGATIAWLMPLILMGLALLIAFRLKIDIPVKEKSMLSVYHSIREGWHFILKTRTLLNVMALDMFAVLFGGAVALLPAFADEILNVGSEGLGLLRAAPALGSGAMAIFLALNPMTVITAKRLLWAVTGFGISMIGFGLSQNFYLSMLCLAMSGAFDSVSMVIRGTLMQWLTPDTMRGRVSSVNSMFIISSNEIGAFESGLTARLFGLVPSVVFGGIGTLTVAGITALSKPFRQLEIKSE